MKTSFDFALIHSIAQFWRTRKSICTLRWEIGKLLDIILDQMINGIKMNAAIILCSLPRCSTRTFPPFTVLNESIVFKNTHSRFSCSPISPKKMRYAFGTRHSVVYAVVRVVCKVVHGTHGRALLICVFYRSIFFIIFLSSLVFFKICLLGINKCI